MANSLAWGGHQNGLIPQSQLAQVSNYRPLPGEPVGPLASFMRSDAARQWAVMDAHYFATKGRHLTVSEGYRSLPDQRNRYSIFQRVGHPLAAYPGTSLHGWGLSCDAGAEGRAWMTVNGPRFGWHPTGRSFSRPEPWHFDYLGGGDITKTPDEINATNPSSGGRPTPALLPASNGDNMLQIRVNEAGPFYGLILNVAPEFVHAPGNVAEGDIVRDVISNPDERHELDLQGFRRVLLGHGIPNDIVTDPHKVVDDWQGYWSAKKVLEQELAAVSAKLDAVLAALTPKK